MFQCSSASRKFLNPIRFCNTQTDVNVSVLFSEPKIPQFCSRGRCRDAGARFSALQRAENSSIDPKCAILVYVPQVSVLFSEPKIPQYHKLKRVSRYQPEFQCSSASRKFLNDAGLSLPRGRRSLFQCSSASRKFLNDRRSAARARCRNVSVLFSEPKIPQLIKPRGDQRTPRRGFSALQRAENSSIEYVLIRNLRPVERVSVLFSEPKIPQSNDVPTADSPEHTVSVLFSEPKIPQFAFD